MICWKSRCIILRFFGGRPFGGLEITPPSYTIHESHIHGDIFPLTTCNLKPVNYANIRSPRVSFLQPQVFETSDRQVHACHRGRWLSSFWDLHGRPVKLTRPIWLMVNHHLNWCLNWCSGLLRAGSTILENIQSDPQDWWSKFMMVPMTQPLEPGITKLISQLLCSVGFPVNLGGWISHMKPVAMGWMIWPVCNT